MKIAFLFPGQGSQYVGMGQDLFKEYNAAREVFLEVDDVLEEKLSTLIFEGNIEKLTLTKNAQPAIMAVSIAVLRVMLHRGLDFEKLDIFAGHSLGEYTALCASGVLSLKDTTIILRQRGLAMQKAVAEGEGLMVAVLGMESEVVRNLMIDGKFDSNLIQVANDNDPSQVVISGKKKVVIQFAEFLKRNGAKRIIYLAVSAPFHSPLMAPAALTMRNELEKVDFANPIIPIIQNFDLNVLYKCDGLVDDQTTNDGAAPDALQSASANGQQSDKDQ